MFIVIAVEHTDDIGNIPMYLEKFDTRKEAETFAENHLKECLEENENQVMFEDCYGLYSVDSMGMTNYSYVLNICEI